MPAFIPPHKVYDSIVTCEERLEMCKIAFKDVDKTVVSNLEISRGGKSYTYLTLQELTGDEIDLYFLCGTDMIISMDTWKNPDIIFSLANICFIRRENDEFNTELINQKCKLYNEKYGAKVMPINADVIEISSSEIRNGDIESSPYLSCEVKKYISLKGLYK
jgi:nicotinate-nucleotide adenylyltransferase